MPRPFTTTEQFWAKFRRGEPDECWEWQGATRRDGYGALTWHGKTSAAHRVAYALHHGAPIPAGMKVLHRCDNRVCCNPSHLFLGTQQDNMRDMFTKGRSLAGEKNPQAKLTRKQVSYIRSSSSANITCRALAARLGVAFTTINAIRNNRIWR